MPAAYPDPDRPSRGVSDLDRIGEVVGSGEHLALADEAATRSITLPRDEDGLIPADPHQYSRVLHVVYARGEDLTAGSALTASLGVYFRDVATRRLTPESTAAAYQDLEWVRGSSDMVVVSAFVPPRAGAGDVAVAGFLAAMLKGYNPETSLNYAMCAGRNNLYGMNATDGLTDWDTMTQEMTNSDGRTARTDAN